MDERGPRHLRLRTSRGARMSLIVSAIALCPALLVSAPAGAGTYRAAICDPRVGAGYLDASFRRTSHAYVGEASCRDGQRGLVVRHDEGSTGEGMWGAWTVRAPSGIAIYRLGVAAGGLATGGYVPQLLTAPLTGPLEPFARPDHGLARATWSGPPARALVARLACRRASGCSGGHRGRVRIKRLSMRLSDRTSPSVALDGPMFIPGSRRGEQAVVASATDVGGGVHRFLLQVNGEPVTAHTVPCRTTDGVALSLRPCPGQATTTFMAATRGAPFRQGPNLVRACVVDYAIGTAANRACAQRRVRIDNLCPISSSGMGTRLDARLSRPGHGHRARSGGRGNVQGRLRSSTGAPVAGATVCVAARVELADAPERIVATPTTGRDGRFSAKLPRGPSRRLRVAYWPGTEGAVERHLRIRVRARPRLRLRPRHPIRNEHRLRFQVRLPGPAAAKRRVRIQAHGGKRWIDLRTGRTGSRGVYRADYRFHATTERRKYAFRAIVPRQEGYPYRGGRSTIRRATVIG